MVLKLKTKKIMERAKVFEFKGGCNLVNEIGYERGRGTCDDNIIYIEK
jgi:hypothetical protein